MKNLENVYFTAQIQFFLEIFGLLQKPSSNLFVG